MANVGVVTSLIVIFGMINLLAVFSADILGTPSIGDYVVYQMFSEQDFNSKTISSFDESFEEGFDKTQTEETNTGALIGIFDGLKKVFSFIITLLSFGFALFFQLQMLGSPFIISAILGLPTALLFYLGVVSAVRGFAI